MTLTERVPDGPRFRMTLYVSGASDISRRAIAGARAFCDAHLAGRCDLLVMDLESHADAARADGILATPTLIRTDPLPQRRFVGDLWEDERVAEALGVPVVSEPQRPVG
jgi:circadian clock protein KaiB